MILSNYHKRWYHDHIKKKDKISVGPVWYLLQHDTKINWPTENQKSVCCTLSKLKKVLHLITLKYYRTIRSTSLNKQKWVVKRAFDPNFKYHVRKCCVMHSLTCLLHYLRTHSHTLFFYNVDPAGIFQIHFNRTN